MKNTSSLSEMKKRLKKHDDNLDETQSLVSPTTQEGTLEKSFQNNNIIKHEAPQVDELDLLKDFKATEESTNDIVPPFNLEFPKEESDELGMLDDHEVDDLLSNLNEYQQEPESKIKELAIENIRIKKENDNLKNYFYKVINLKYNNIYVLDPNGQGLSKQFIDFIEEQSNQSLSYEFNHLQAELLEYKYNLKKQEDLITLIKDERDELQKLYSDECLKVTQLENNLREIEEEAKQLALVHQDIKQIHIEEKSILEQKNKSLQTYYENAMKSSQELFGKFFDDFEKKIEMSNNQYETIIMQLEKELSDLKVENEKLKKQYFDHQEQLKKELYQLKEENYLLKVYLSSSGVLPITSHAPQIFNQRTPIDNNNHINLLKDNLISQLNHLDRSLFSLYNYEFNRNDNLDTYENQKIKDELTELNEKIELLFSMQNNQKSFEKQLIKKNFKDLDNIITPRREKSNNQLLDDIKVFKQQLESFSKDTYVTKRVNPIDEKLQNIFNTCDESAINTLNIHPELKAQILSLCVMKKMIIERAQIKEAEHEKELSLINDQINEINDQIKILKYSIFEIQYDEQYKQDYTPLQLERRRAELLYQLSTKEDELNALKEIDQQNIKLKYLNYLEEKNAQLEKIAYEEEKIKMLIKNSLPN